MFTEIKQIETAYEERMGFPIQQQPGARISLTGLIVKALFAIAREVDALKKEVYVRNGKSD